MGRRVFSREFKLEAVKLVRDRGVAVREAARDLDVHSSALYFSYISSGVWAMCSARK